MGAKGAWELERVRRVLLLHSHTCSPKCRCQLVRPSLMGRANHLPIALPEVELRRQGAHLDPANRASVLILYMDSAAREVCAAAGRGVIMGREGAMKITVLLRDYFAPDAVESAYQEVARF